MNDMNVLAINGRLVKNAILSYSNSGMAIGKFSIASNRSVKKNDKWEDEAGFYDCVMFGKMAQSVNQYLTKGQQVSIAGEIRQERWEKDGKQNSKVVIIVNHLQLIGGKDDKQIYQKSQQKPNTPENFVDDSSELIPF
jgi:single-strand DNA-binding protein